MMERAPWRVCEVRDLGRYRLAVRFADGTAGEVDVSQLILSDSPGVFKSLRSEVQFAQVFVEYGAVTWPNGPDLAPDAMYDAIRSHGSWTPE